MPSLDSEATTEADAGYPYATGEVAATTDLAKQDALATAGLGGGERTT